MTDDSGPAGPERAVRTAGAALAAVAALLAAWSGWSWYAAAHDDSLSYARTRDQVLQAGEQAVQNLNTLDYRTADKGLRIWEDSTTGDLHQQIAAGRAGFVLRLATARTVTTAKILEGAVTELDTHAGSASVIVALQIVVTPPQGDPATRQSRMAGKLTRTAAGWKLSALGQAPTGGAGGS